MTKIAINDLHRHANKIGPDLRQALERVLTSGWYVLGQEYSNFEREFAVYCDGAHCIALANGTDALELSLRALDVGKGMRVATVANAGFYSATAIRLVGAVPVYVDVDAAERVNDFETAQCGI